MPEESFPLGEPTAKDRRPAEGPLDVPPEHVLLFSGGRGWNGIDAAEVVHPEDDFGLPAVPRHVVIVNLAKPFDAEEKLRRREGRMSMGGLVLLPAGAPSEWHLERQGEVRHLHLYLDPALVRDVAHGAGLDPDKAELVEALGVRDPQVEHASMLLLTELRSGGLGGKIHAESLASVLAVHLLRRHSSLGRERTRQLEHERADGLPQPLLRVAIDYINDNLAQDLTLTAIAASVSLSPYHFARMFKRSIGLSPHQYVVCQRIERAKSLLTNTTLPVGEVSREVGFASPSHFTQQFGRLVGVTPSTFR